MDSSARPGGEVFFWPPSPVFLDELQGYLAPYYARVRFDPDTNSYVFFDETLQLDHRAELMQRLRRDGDGM